MANPVESKCENRIEGKCGCGGCNYRCFPDESYWYWHAPGEGAVSSPKYCPNCGYRLADDGFARRTVVVPEDPIYHRWPAPLEDPPGTPLETAGCRMVRYILIPASGEGSHNDQPS